jgi:hypothetical protein
MGSDQEVKVLITSDVSGLQDGASQAVDSSKTISDTLDELKAKAESGGEGLDEAGKAAGAFGSALSSMGEIAAGVFGGIELEGIAEKFKSFFEDATVGTFEWGESLNNLSISTGLTTEQLQVLQYAADVTGVNFGRLQQVVNRLSLAMLQFQQGSKSVTNAAQVLGIDPSTFTDAYDALGKIGERVKEIGTLTLEQRGALETFLGGRGGAQILPAIERLQEFQDEAKATGVILSDDMVKSADEAAESINRLSARWDAFKHTIGGETAELLNGIVDSFKELGEASAGVDPTHNLVPVISDSVSKTPGAELQPATDAQTKLQAAVTSTTSAIDLQAAAIKELAGIAPETMSQIRDEAEANDLAWQQMNQDLTEGAAAATAHVRQYWQELQSAADATKESLKADSEEIGSVFQSVSQAFETSFNGVIQGTQTMSQAWAKMLDSMGLELLKSGLHDLLLGGTKNTIGAEIFGTTGQGGGIAGQIAQAFSGSAVATGLKTSLTTAWNALTAPITNVFGQAFNGISGIIKNLFGSALSGAGGAVASGGGAALGAAGGASQLAVLTSIEATLTTELSLILGTLVAANVALDAMNAELITLDTIEAAKIVQPLGFSGGGIVPSAAGGMIVGGGGASLNILHPKEMVLPPHLSEGIQSAINSGTFGGGGGGDNITVNLAISAIDGPSVENLFNQGRVKDLIGNAVLAKVRDSRAVGQGAHRGVFRR